ncbi:hypothetical protein OIE66_00635 [Nonomuraea sp. NBC_01738]|uniref:AfsR/SARP family transcriptional regulator n=1 Tax=Nonomuraea sp. NBC_01738 TaxID=2976003 RepID=UPI002E1050B2|nr:hypothetical protein OIE66_00635 [Nonomuraea sp. NBC_01738]
MRIGILGPLLVSGREVGGARVRSLIVRLALDRGRVVTSERLIDDLWPDAAPAHPQAALQSLVSRARRETGGAIASHLSGYRVDAEVDAFDFERLVRAGEVRAGLGLWRGPALYDAAGLPFAVGPAARLEELRLSALEVALGLDLAAGVDVLADLEGLVAEHPLREGFHALLVEGLTAAGRRGEALAAFERVRGALADDLGAAPGPALRAAHLRALREDSSEAASGRGGSREAPAAGQPGGDAPAAEVADSSAATTSGDIPGSSMTGVHDSPTTAAPGRSTPNLPRSPATDIHDASTADVHGSPAGRARDSWAGPAWASAGIPARLSSFVGRSDDISRIRDVLQQARLITLTGPGGVGKTRLAVEAAEGLDPVWVVELGALPSPTLSPSSPSPSPIRSTPPTAGPVAGGVRGAVEAVLRTSDPIATLRGLDATLVLDNCEHVIDEAASIAEWLLTEVPGLRIIATSREPLDIPGEILHPVSPLDKATAERLFRERATAVNSTLSAMTPSPDESDPIARICAELDGIPLAIELAAVRLRSMPVSVLVEQLGERLGFRGSRTAPPRHRTLRAVIDWSWEPLSPEERHLLRGLSVFSGGATVEAITRVCGGDVPTLSALVDKSLATLNGDRYTMLETIRAYVREKGDLSPFQHAHAAYYTELAESAEPYLRTGDQLRWLAILDAEQGNLDAALAHTDDPLRLTLARLWPWAMRGRVREARTHAATILKSLPHSHPDATPGTPIAAPAQGSAHVGFSAGTTQEPARSGPLTTSADAPSAPDRTLALSVCRLLLGQQPDAVLRESEHPVALASWALAERIGPPEGVVAMAEGGVERLGGHPDPWVRAAVRLMGGIVRFEYGRVGMAEELLLPALAGFRETGDRWGLAFTLFWLSLAAENRGDFRQALELAEASERPAAEIGGLEVLPGPLMALVRLGRLRGLTGDLAGAADTLARAQEAADRLRDPLATVRVLHARGELAALADDPDTAVALLHEAWERAPGAGAPPQLQALINVGMAEVTGEWEPIRRALELMEHGDDRTVRATVLEAAAQQVTPERAGVLLAAASALRGLGGQEIPNPERYALSPPSSP